MFGNLKEKLISVGKNVLFSDVKPPVSQNYPEVNLNAGAQILSYFQDNWEQIHELNEDNAQHADIVAKMIDEMHKKICSDHRNVTDITYLLSNGTQNLSESVVSCVEQLKSLQSSFESVENELVQLEDLIETLELQEKQLEHRFQLAMYKEKKLANLEMLRVELVEKHTKSVSEFERKQKEKLQERQKAFQEAFQTDLQLYKQAGTLPSKYK